MTRFVRSAVVLAAVLTIGGLLTSCDAEELPGAPEGSETTEVPPETEAPPAEIPPPESGDDETPWWVLLIVLFGLFVLFIALLVGRGRKSDVPTAPEAWKAPAQHGYAEARWLSDNMTESLAIWHGDAEFDGDDASSATDASRARVWDQLTPRMERATSELYALEAAAGPNSPALRAAQSTISALNDTYGAMTERSDARTAYRTVAEDEDPPAADLRTARDREGRASGSLSAAQRQLSTALTDLSAIS